MEEEEKVEAAFEGELGAPLSSTAALDESGRQRSASLGDESASQLLPPRPERTLKEKLVERERQKRIETERARLKRQFALSHGSGGAEESVEEGDKENGSLVGTVGDASSVAAQVAEIEEDDEKDANEVNVELGYTMERFLSEQAGTEGNSTEVPPGTSVQQENEAGGVVMERFLAEPVVPQETVEDSSPPAVGAREEFGLGEPTRPSDAPVQRSDSVDALMDDQEEPASLDLAVDRGLNIGTNHSFASTMESRPTSTPVQAEEGDAEIDDLHGDRIEVGDQEEAASPSMNAASSISSDHSTRVLRLTEREIQEMAAIEEASIGNAPPTERDDISEVGSLIGGFGDVHGDDGHGSLSIQTVTTASASITSVGGHHSVDAEAERISGNQSIDGMATASVSSHLALSPGASNEGSVSVAANPPSVIANVDPLRSLPDEDAGHNSGGMERAPSVPSVVPAPSTPPELPHLGIEDEPLDAGASAAANADVVNRTVRPGLVETPPRRVAIREIPTSTGSMKRSISMPQTPSFVVDGFDFDKNSCLPRSPFDSLRELPGDDFPLSPNRNHAPSNGNREALLTVRQDIWNYGATAVEGVPGDNQTRALLNVEANWKASSMDQVQTNDAKVAVASKYREKIVDGCDPPDNLQAFSDRLPGLVVALIVELPVILMIVNSRNLCQMVGKENFMIWIAFVFVSCALSGNSALFVQQVTTRAISEDAALQRFWSNASSELLATAYLAAVFGFVVGGVVFAISSFNIPLALSVAFGQSGGMICSGLTGVLAPYLLQQYLRLEPTRWSLQLVPVIQDLVGILFMVMISSKVIAWFGESRVDTC